MVCGSNGWWIPFMMIHYFVFMDEFSWNKTNRTISYYHGWSYYQTHAQNHSFALQCYPDVDQTERAEERKTITPCPNFVRADSSPCSPLLCTRAPEARAHTHSLSRGIGDCPQFLALGLHKQLSKIVAHQEREEFKRLLLFWVWRNG